MHCLHPSLDYARYCSAIVYANHASRRAEKTPGGPAPTPAQMRMSKERAAPCPSYIDIGRDAQFAVVVRVRSHMPLMKFPTPHAGSATSRPSLPTAQPAHSSALPPCFGPQPRVNCPIAIGRIGKPVGSPMERSAVALVVGIAIQVVLPP